jgi:acyl-ACP thioesterase
MYSYDSTVRYSECDANGNLTLLAMINYLQDGSIFHSEALGRGVRYMYERDQAWLIAAWQIEIERLPHFNEHIVIETWCYSVARTLAARNFVISNDEGEQLVRADSLWFVFDTAKGRPIRIPAEQMVFESGEPRLDMPPTSRRLPVEGGFVEAEPITVGELHLDSNRHVNNAQYLGMATNAIAQVFGHEAMSQTTSIARICVQYKRQALLGDAIVPRVHAGEGVCTVDLADQEGDTFSVVRIETR